MGDESIRVIRGDQGRVLTSTYDEMNWFGKKKAPQQPSAVSSTTTNSGGGGSASRTNTANTVVSLRENIATQDKR